TGDCGGRVSASRVNRPPQCIINQFRTNRRPRRLTEKAIPVGQAFDWRLSRQRSFVVLGASEWLDGTDDTFRPRINPSDQIAEPARSGFVVVQARRAPPLSIIHETPAQTTKLRPAATCSLADREHRQSPALSSALQ